MDVLETSAVFKLIFLNLSRVHLSNSTRVLLKLIVAHDFRSGEAWN